MRTVKNVTKTGNWMTINNFSICEGNYEGYKEIRPRVDAWIIRNSYRVINTFINLQSYIVTCILQLSIYFAPEKSRPTNVPCPYRNKIMFPLEENNNSKLSHNALIIPSMSCTFKLCNNKDINQNHMLCI